jgi:salicylate hydroxylase
MLDASFGPLCSIELGETFRDRFEGRYLCIHRADLHDILLAAAAATSNVALESASLVTAIEQSADRITAVTAEGRRIDGDLLIASDGLKSSIRETMHPNDGLRLSGYVAHRSVVPMSQVPDVVRRDEVTLWVGEGYHLIYYPLRGGTELNLVGVFEEARLPPVEPHERYRDAVLQSVAQDDEEVRAALGLMDLSRRWPIADRNPITHWSSGRMTLLGDSAHATLQSLAQGAGMAIEDAIVLADLLAPGVDNWQEALTEFESQRYARTSRVQLESRALWTMYHCGGRERDARNRLYRGKTTENFLNCLAWLWVPVTLEGGAVA